MRKAVNTKQLSCSHGNKIVSLCLYKYKCMMACATKQQHWKVVVLSTSF